ncbi:unnamed protein product [Periconia digitata]|uniref:Uncharacterized protein n=1 Tax=Periconia digitata TaxID=1303443 RepID=A0A9W4XFJ2_9PLEO|nr:unnamed protein product [Periconia digitata]
MVSRRVHRDDDDDDDDDDDECAAATPLHQASLFPDLHASQQASLPNEIISKVCAAAKSKIAWGHEMVGWSVGGGMERPETNGGLVRFNTLGPTSPHFSLSLSLLPAHQSCNNSRAASPLLSIVLARYCLGETEVIPLGTLPHTFSMPDEALHGTVLQYLSYPTKAKTRIRYSLRSPQPQPTALKRKRGTTDRYKWRGTSTRDHPTGFLFVMTPATQERASPLLSPFHNMLRSCNRGTKTRIQSAISFLLSYPPSIPFPSLSHW